LATTIGDAKGSIDFLEQLYLAQISTQRQIYVHRTCCTDTEQMRVIFRAIKDIAITTYLSQQGFGSFSPSPPSRSSKSSTLSQSQIIL